MNKLSSIMLCAVTMLLSSAVPDPLAAQDSDAGPPSPCSGPEHRQFDFWVGDWTVTTQDGSVAGTNRIESILSGCALRETWTGSKGTLGTSLNVYSPRDGLWRQTWIDTTGTLLEIRGGLRDGNMVMEGDAVGRDGKPVTHRITWTPVDPDRVKQVWEVSRDGGSSWTAVFVGSYSPSK